MKQELIMTDAFGKKHDYALMNQLVKLLNIRLNKLRRQRTRINEKISHLVHGDKVCFYTASKMHKESMNLYKQIKNLKTQIHNLTHFNITIKTEQ